MNSKLFKLKDILPPANVVVTGMGNVSLSAASDETLVKLYKNGCPFLELTEQGEKHPLLMPVAAPAMKEFKPAEVKPKALPIKPAVKKATRKP